MIVESLDRNKWRILWWILGTTGLGSVLAAALGVVFLLILIISLVGSTLHSDGFSTYPTSATTGDISNSLSITGNWKGQSNQPVVAWAERMSPHLLNCGAENYTQCYDASFPQQVLSFWQNTCGGACERYWAQGDLQCVMFVTGAYGAAGQQLPIAQNAVLFWEDYANIPGWGEISNGSGLPIPGDMLVWQNGTYLAYPGSGAGHIAIVIDVKPPTSTQPGFIQFAQANAPNRIDTQPVDTSGYMHTWAGYKVLGYIRHTAYFQQKG